MFTFDYESNFADPSAGDAELEKHKAQAVAAIGPDIIAAHASIYSNPDGTRKLKSSWRIMNSTELLARAEQERRESEAKAERERGHQEAIAKHEAAVKAMAKAQQPAG